MGAITETKYLVQAGIRDVPHVSPEMLAMIEKDTAPFQRDARMLGTPSLGAGAIYPVPESDIKVPAFDVPPTWPRAYGMDVGWNRTAVIWGAKDPDSDVVYLYTEHYMGHASPAVHATAIKARGAWIQGAIDPASRSSGQKDGAQLLTDYMEAGLNLHKADNSREAGLLDVYRRLVGGTLKVMDCCQSWFAEYRFYRRDTDGKVVKENDHIMDATRYLIVTGLDLMMVEPVRPKMTGTYRPADATIGY